MGTVAVTKPLAFAIALILASGSLCKLTAQDPFAAAGNNSMTDTQREAHVELALLRRVCKLTQAQEAEIEVAAKALRDAKNEAPQNAARQFLRHGPFFVARGGARGRKDSITQASEALDQTIEEVLTEEQRVVFAAAKRSREKFRDQAAADVLLECLQQRLWLSDEQCEAIREELVSWVAGKQLAASTYITNTNYLPGIPERLLSPHLSEDQMNAFSRVQKVTFSGNQLNRGQPQPLIEK